MATRRAEQHDRRRYNWATLPDLVVYWAGTLPESGWSGGVNELSEELWTVRSLFLQRTQGPHPWHDLTPTKGLVSRAVEDASPALAELGWEVTFRRRSWGLLITVQRCSTEGVKP